jgi:hypothetical protein
MLFDSDVYLENCTSQDVCSTTFSYWFMTSNYYEEVVLEFHFIQYISHFKFFLSL